ncbi:hypothetical protein TESG_02106 [Trichophyton tonsurans CBS 112818]|uniref:Uncharacterized protein n=1 Tax=Trichophyton tonsurans (strain CBS 112818) TaxID=647933 RepID=F2RTE8_TRIT1|nr:hypothetical protein TESG_02106 [Trichophyton tonsurans CBS 112818]
MDPLSITASVAGLITLAGVIISRGFQISDRFTNTEKELNSLLNEVSSFSGLLVGVKSHFEQHQASTPISIFSPNVRRLRAGDQLSTTPARHLRTALNDCNSILEDVKRLVEKISRTPTFQIALRSEVFLKEAVRLAAKLERYKSFFILAFQLNSRAREEESRSITSSMKNQLETIGAAQKRLEEKHEAEIQGKMKDEILDWLGNATVAAHSDSLESRHPESGEWFLSSSEFIDWISGDSSNLWLDGIAGSGKTVLMSMAIDYLQELAENKDELSVAYHYCGSPETRQDGLGKLLGRLVSQVLRQAKPGPTLSDTFNTLSRLKYRSRYPSLEKMKMTLTTIGSCLSTVFMVIDGIDELADSDGLLRIIREISAASKSFQIFDIKSNLNCDLIDSDIERYVRSRVSNFRWRGVPDMEEIIQGLVKGADGMFLWVVYQLDSLSRIRTAIPKSALRSLPRGLGHTYETTLSKLSDEDKCLALRILQFILYSERGLHLAELVEAIAIDPGQMNPQQLKGNKLRNEEDVFEICSNLIRRSKATGHIMLAHHSVREFLISPSLESGDLNPFYLRDIDSSIKIAMSCLTYLNFQDCHSLSISEVIPEDALDRLVAEYPFLSYAACNWSRHIPTIYAESQFLLEPIIKKFLNPELGGLKFWIAFAQYTYGRFRIPSKLTSLHVCSIVGACEEIIQLASPKENADIRTERGQTALHLAIDNGHMELIGSLIKAGVPINTQDGYGQSALHKAIELGDKSAVTSLLSAGANVNLITHDGATAFSIAADNSWTTVMYLIAHEVKTEVTLPDGRTVLHLAAQSGDIESAHELIKRDNSLLHQKDPNEWTALHFAAHHGQTRMVNFLLDKGVMPSLDINEWSPAHSIIQRRDTTTLRRLLGCRWSAEYKPDHSDVLNPGVLLHRPMYHSHSQKYGYTASGSSERGLFGRLPQSPPGFPQSPPGGGRTSGEDGHSIEPRLPKFYSIIRSLLDLAISLNYPEGFGCLIECQGEYTVRILGKLRQLKLVLEVPGGSELFRLLFLESPPTYQLNILLFALTESRSDFRSAVQHAIQNSPPRLHGSLLRHSVDRLKALPLEFLVDTLSPGQMLSALRCAIEQDYDFDSVAQKYTIRRSLCLRTFLRILIYDNHSDPISSSSGCSINDGLRLQNDHFTFLLLEELVFRGPAQIRNVFSNFTHFSDESPSLDLVTSLIDYANEKRGFSYGADRFINDILSSTLLLAKTARRPDIVAMLQEAGADDKVVGKAQHAIPTESRKDLEIVDKLDQLRLEFATVEDGREWWKASH